MSEFLRAVARAWMADPGRWLFLSALVLALVLTLFPDIDILVAGLFFEDGRWVGAHDPLNQFVDKGLPTGLYGILIYIALLWAAGRLLNCRFFGIDDRLTGFLVASLAVGPGLLANAVFKENWGRARPRQIVEFGGDSIHSPALVISDQCASNCSFVSGHGALGFWAVALAMVVPGQWRRPAMVGALVFGVLVGLSRMMQGAHFLSDTLYAGLLVVAVNVALHKAIVEGRVPARPRLPTRPAPMPTVAPRAPDAAPPVEAAPAAERQGEEEPVS